MSAAGFLQAACLLGGIAEAGAGVATRQLQGAEQGADEVLVDIGVGCLSAIVGGGGGSSGGRQAVRDLVESFVGGPAPVFP